MYALNLGFSLLLENRLLEARILLKYKGVFFIY